MGNGWHKIIGWQGLYNNVYLVKFTIATQNKMRYHIQTDTEIINIVEKQVISDDAICGCYYFINKLIFTTAAKKYISNSLDKEYYIISVRFHSSKPIV